ncbi:MAG: hypothetical protein NTY66_00380 [Candidatus Vogelbacteria bacterium]|nr:hypothetical protein [Candidatus Vogelbacteria bacterium]
MNKFETTNSASGVESEAVKLERMKEKLQAWIAPEGDPEEARARLGVMEVRRNGLRAKFGLAECRKYKTFFLLSEGDKTAPESAVVLDFPGQDSIENWVTEDLRV